jgi:phage terminase large subunit-like protein
VDLSKSTSPQLDSSSVANWLASKPESERETYLSSLAETGTDAHKLLYSWEFWARPSQLPPAGDWLTWLLMAGRGFGKTRTGAEWVRAETNHAASFALVGPTAADVRDVMVEGDSGVLAVFPPELRPHYYPSKRKVMFRNGATAMLYSADEPDRLRGPQHERAWSDELAAWRYPEAWDMLQLGLRIGRPRQVVTTTPRPVSIVRQLVKNPTTVVTRGSTHDNLMNLAENFAAQVISRYEGTTLGRQEVYGELLEDFPGALWHRAMIEANRVEQAPRQQRIVVAVDPAVTTNADSDETGIAVAGKGEDGDYYVFEVYGVRLSPHGWANSALRMRDEWEADRIVAERNNGGDMVEATLRQLDRDVPLATIHASRG